MIWRCSLLGTVGTQYNAIKVAIAGNYAYVADGYGGLQVVDVSDPTSPLLIDYITMHNTHNVSDLAIFGRYLYASDGNYWGPKIEVLDISDPAHCVFVGNAIAPSGYGIGVSATHAFIAGPSGLYSIPLQCAPVGVLDPESSAVLRGLRVYPNPFNPQTTVVFELATPGPARLQIFDLAGRLIMTLVDGTIPAGRHEVAWNGRDTDGREVPSGAYLSRLQAAGKVTIGRMTLIR